MNLMLMKGETKYGNQIFMKAKVRDSLIRHKAAKEEDFEQVIVMEDTEKYGSIVDLLVKYQNMDK